MKNTPIDMVVKDTRACNCFMKAGYTEYDDIKDMSLYNIKKIEGMGEVSANKAFIQIQEYKKFLYEDLAKKVIKVADKVGIEKVWEAIERIEDE